MIGKIVKCFTFVDSMKRIVITLVAICISVATFSQQKGTAAQMPANVAYYEQNLNLTQRDGRSNNHAPTFFIYPDSKLDEAGAKKLVEDLDMRDVLVENHVKVFVINPIGENYDNSADFEGFKEVFNKARSGNLKVIGIGNGATFVNTAIAPTDAAGHIAGILSIDGKPGITPDSSWGVPAYIAGKKAAKAAKPYIAMNKGVRCGSKYVNEDEELLAVIVDESSSISLAGIFDKAWDELFSKNLRFNNYKHTHYNGAKFGEYGPYELEPYTVHESLGIKRELVIMEQKKGLPWLWYEYWPEELMSGAPAGSVPVMVLLHGNTNDPRTQAETSGFIQVAGKERFFIVEMEWQGSKDYGAMGYDGIEKVINILLEKYPQLDPSRIYAQGLSAGAITATALGICKSYLFAGVGGYGGGIYTGAKTGRFSYLPGLWAEATQKRGFVEMPYCSIIGTADQVVPFYTPNDYKGNSYVNAWNTYQQLNGIEVTSELDFASDTLLGLNLADRQTITTNKGNGIKAVTGYFYKGEMPLIKIVAVVDYGHWNFMPGAQMMWDFFKMFSRDPQTKKLIYHGEPILKR